MGAQPFLPKCQMSTSRFCFAIRRKKKLVDLTFNLIIHPFYSVWLLSSNLIKMCSLSLTLLWYLNLQRRRSFKADFATIQNLSLLTGLLWSFSLLLDKMYGMGWDDLVCSSRAYIPAYAKLNSTKLGFQ
jgi:hypothetical protein